MKDTAKSFELIVIGSGPGGYVAAIRAAQLGMKVAIIERENLGGICLNWGCIPTKALLHYSEVYRSIKHASAFGITCKDVSVDLKKMVAKSREAAKKLSQGIEMLMKKNKIEVLYGNAKLLGNNEILIEKSTHKDSVNYANTKVKGTHIILATGARAKELPTLPIDHKIILDYRDAMTLETMPKSMLIVGSGAIGVEFASFYNAIGVDVTILEIANRILINEDEEIAAIAHKSFVKQGMKIMLETKISSLKIEKTHVDVELSDKDGKLTKHKFEKIISAVGVVPNTENLGLEKTKVVTDKGFVKIDEFMRTNEPNLYAIGDITTPPLLAHKASHQGVICVEKIKNLPVHGMKQEDIPACTYSYPQIASIGITEKKAKELKLDVKIGRFPGIGNGKAVAIDETEFSLVKTIFDAKTGELLGAHMIGAEVVEMIQGFVMIKQIEGTEEDIIRSIFPHPTMSEMMHESTLAALQRAIHI